MALSTRLGGKGGELQRCPRWVARAVSMGGARGSKREKTRLELVNEFLSSVKFEIMEPSTRNSLHHYLVLLYKGTLR